MLSSPTSQHGAWFIRHCLYKSPVGLHIYYVPNSITTHIIHLELSRTAGCQQNEKLLCDWKTNDIGYECIQPTQLAVRWVLKVSSPILDTLGAELIPVSWQ